MVLPMLPPAGLDNLYKPVGLACGHKVRRVCLCWSAATAYAACTATQLTLHSLPAPDNLCVHPRPLQFCKHCALEHAGLGKAVGTFRCGGRQHMRCCGCVLLVVLQAGRPQPQPCPCRPSPACSNLCSYVTPRVTCPQCRQPAVYRKAVRMRQLDRVLMARWEAAFVLCTLCACSWRVAWGHARRHALLGRPLSLLLSPCLSSPRHAAGSQPSGRSGGRRSGSASARLPSRWLRPSRAPRCARCSASMRATCC